MFDASPTSTSPPLDRLASRLAERVAAALDGARVRSRDHDADALALGAAEIDLVTACEEIVRIAQGAQLEAIQLLDTRRRDVMDDRVHETVLTRSLFTEVALARRVSTPAGETSYGLARALEHHPRTHELLRDGAISQGVAAAVCRETTYASPEDRLAIDAELAPALAELSPRRAAKEARRLVLAADPHAAYERVVRARAERSVSLRPELDAMATLTVYAPAEQLVGAFERLDREASARRADGDPRTIRQIVTDLAVESLTGLTVRVDGTADVRVEVGVVMSPEQLFTAGDAPATLADYGPIPAELARRLASSEHAWVRRFFTSPDGRDLVGSDPRARRFSAGVRRLVSVVDGQCRRPWCDWRIRDVDHAAPYARGGLSVATNAQGLCQPDNLAKEAPGRQVTTAEGRDGALPGEVRWRTPTGHLHVARRPGGDDAQRPRGEDVTPEAKDDALTVPSADPAAGLPVDSVMEHRLAELVCA